MNLRTLGCCLFTCIFAACATTAPAPTSNADAAMVKELGARTVIATLLSRAQKELTKQPKRAGQTLERAWKLSTQLIDDRIVRAAVSALPAEHAPPTLVRVAKVAKAQDAFADNAIKEVHRHLSSSHTSHDLTEARRLLLLGLVEIGSNPEAAKISLTHVANGGLTSPSGQELQNLARTTVASIEFEQEKLAAAIKNYLRVSEESAYWPTARTAISWAQFQLRKYDRAIAGLKLLPEGLATSPDRVLLAAVCFHHLGNLPGARHIIALAKTHRKAWIETDVTAQQVLTAIGEEVSPFGLVSGVAWDPPLRLLGREINAVDKALQGASGEHKAALNLYRGKAWDKFESMVNRKAKGAKEAATIAYEKLTVLEPQLK